MEEVCTCAMEQITSLTQEIFEAIEEVTEGLDGSLVTAALANIIMAINTVSLQHNISDDDEFQTETH